MTLMTRSLMCVAALLFVGMASRSSAQITAQGSVRGIVTDQQGAAVPGVTVTAKRASDNLPFTAVTDDRGAYRLLDLSPGEYVIEAELSGFSKYLQTGVLVRAGLNIALDIKMAVGSVKETVEVRADTPMLEVEKPVQSVNISGEFQRRLPLNPRRDWSDFLELTPGLNTVPLAASNGSQLYSLRGGSVSDHVFQLDGADIASFRQGLNSYTQLSTEALQDVQIKTGGVDAASPLGVGVVVNVATMSGTNRYTGALGVAYTPESWNGDNSDGGTATTNELLQPELSIGGPIVKDRLWFFGSYRYTQRNTGISRSAQQVANLAALVPGFEPFDNDNRLHYHYYKASGQLGPNHQYQAFYQRELNPEKNNSGTLGQPLSILTLGGHAYGGRFSSVLGSSTTFRISGSYNNKGVNPTFEIFKDYVGEGPSIAVFNRTIASGGILLGSGSLGRLNAIPIRVSSPANKTTIQADLTHFVSGFAGSHELQSGVFLQPRLRWRDRQLYANGGFATESVVLRQAGNPAGGYVPFHRQVFDRESVDTASLRASDYAVYIQDAWKPIARLTINAGVRIDWIKGRDLLLDAVTTESTEIGPRLGFTYPLTRDNNNIVRANWARVHSALSAGTMNTGTSSSSAGVSNFYDLDFDGVFETVRVTPPLTRANATRQIDPDRHLPFIDEWIIGYRRQLPGQTSIDASFIRRSYRDRRALIDTNGIYDGGVFRGYRDVSANEIFLVTNNDWNSLVYSGLEILATKRTRRVQLIGAYTRAFRHISGTWQPNDPASIIQPGAFPNDKGIGGVGGNETSSYSLASSDHQSWQDHAFRSGITYFAPWKLLIATNYSVQSGPYSGPIMTRIATPDPRFGPATITLSNGRQVSNPLATTLRFANATRGDGQIHAPALHVWNLRAGRDFPLGSRRLEVAFDVFNVTNSGTDTQFLEEEGNALFSENFGRRPDGSFNGTNRQFARSGQVSFRFVF